MEEINFDIIEYIGKLDGGIFVLLSLSYQSVYYDAVFYYKEGVVAITPDSKLELKLQSPIEFWEGYSRLMMRILDRVVPYDEMIKTINDFDSKIYQIRMPNK